MKLTKEELNKTNGFVLFWVVWFWVIGIILKKKEGGGE